MTREQWLLTATDKFRHGLFKDAHASLPVGVSAIIPTVRVSVGFPKGRGGRGQAIGQYWPSLAVQDAIPQVFISPVIDDGARALDILAHELVHACTPGAGHKTPFKQLAIAIGLTGKMTATVAGPELTARLNSLLTELGPYPNSRINLNAGPKKQSTRLLKCECTSCGYTCRVTATWLESTGAPICPCSGSAMVSV